MVGPSSALFNDFFFFTRVLFSISHLEPVSSQDSDCHFTSFLDFLYSGDHCVTELDGLGWYG